MLVCVDRAGACASFIVQKTRTFMMHMCTRQRQEHGAEGYWLETMQKFRLGVPIRDMRLLDPNLLTSETGKILVRDNAIVFSVEHVRLIITADCVIIPQTGFEQSSLSTQFAVMLEEAIIEASQEKEVGASILILVTARPVYFGILFRDAAKGKIIQ